MRGNRGFTLIEVIVVAAIIAILAGILVPMIFNQIDEARTARAQGDCKAISTAMLMFRRDTGKWPYFRPANCALTYLTLQSGTGTDPVDAAGADAWQVGINPVAFGVILNLPGVTPPVVQTCYNNKAAIYMSEDKPDPWGHNYIVNAANFDTSNPVWVISAGPNGNLETGVNSSTLNDLATAAGVVGDDIGVRIK